MKIRRKPETRKAPRGGRAKSPHKQWKELVEIAHRKGMRAVNRKQLQEAGYTLGRTMQDFKKHIKRLETRDVIFEELRQWEVAELDLQKLEGEFKELKVTIGKHREEYVAKMKPLDDRFLQLNNSLYFRRQDHDANRRDITRRLQQVPW